MDLGLNGKRAIVTGASQGIGAATAKLLAAEGCEVVLVARSADRLEAQARAITAETGTPVHPFSADLSQSNEAARLVAAHDDIDILVNNAGAIPGGTLDDVDEATWRRAWDLKVFGYINLTRLILVQMRRRQSGVIVNVIGAAAQIKDPSYICGVTGNAALTALTMSLGSGSPQYGVRVVGISPGPVATERLLALNATVESAAVRPFGRAAMPEEIAAAVAFLASPASGYTSGTVLMIDGGISSRAASA